MRRKRIEGLTPAIKQVLKDHNNALSGKDICHEIKDRQLVDIEPEQEEITYGQPNFHHSVRKILSELAKRGEVTRVKRGMFIITSNNNTKR